MNDGSARGPDATSSTSTGFSGPSLWDGLDPAVWARLDAVTTTVEMAGGEWLFREGDGADAMYVVRRGRLDVVVGDQVIRSIGPGEVIGELALLTGQPRSAGIRAARDSVLQCLSERSFQRAVAEDSALLLEVTRSIARRLQSVSPPRLASAPPTVVAVVAVTDDAPGEFVARGLTDALGEFMTATLLGDDDPARVATAHGAADAARLDAAEATHERVVLHTTAAPSPWRDFCLRNADRVVVVVGRRELTADLAAEVKDLLTTAGASARAGTGTGPDEFPTGAVRDCHLVFVGRAPSRTELVAAYDMFAVATVHRVSEGALRKDLRPLAARLAGRSLGLALAGGGARALAHIGVLEVFADAGIEFDRVAGTSMGAIIGAAWATGRDSAGIYSAVYNEFVKRNPLRDYTIPKYGLIRGRRARAGLERQFGDVLIEELPHEFSCVSVDLLAKRPVVHRRGRLVDALLAPSRLPGIFPPFRLDGGLHVDGTVLENLPLSALTGRGDGPLIAVDVGSGAGAAGRSPGRPPRMPTLSETILRTTLMGGATAAREARAQADLLITAEVSGIGMFSWRDIDAARDAGRRAAEDALPAVKALLTGPDAARRLAVDA